MRARPPGLAGLFASAVVKARYLIVAAWLAVAVMVTLGLPTVQEAQVGALGDLVPRDADAIEAELRSNELFGFPLLSRTLVVQRDPEGLSAAEQARVARRALALNRGEYPGLGRIAGALPVTNLLGEPPFSRERSTTAITYLFFRPQVGREDREQLAQRFVERRIEPSFDGFVGVTGTVSARSEQAELITEKLPLVEIGTVLLVLLVVGLHFRAPGAPVVALMAVAIAYLTSIRLIAWAGERLGVSVPSEIEPVIVVLLFGVVTDYVIFFQSRVRSRIADGEEPRTASVRGTAELLPIILTAGLTVAGATASLIVAQLGFFQAFGPGTAMAVLVGLAVGVTLVPALLAIGGRVVFWPNRPGVELSAGDAAEGTADERLARPGRYRLLKLATEKPVLIAALITVVLLAAASGLTRLDLGNPVIRGLPAGAEARQAYEQASRGFASGILSPTVIVVEGTGITRRRRALARLQRSLERQPGVAEVVGPADQPLDRGFGAVLSRTGDAVRYFVVFGSDPLGTGAIADLRRLRVRMPDLLDAAGLSNGTDVLVAGDTALVAETIDGAVDDMWRIAPAALVVVIVVLALFLRALVAPLYLVAASALAVAASLGLTTYLFLGLLDHGEMSYFVPFAAAVLLVSLGSDYNVFLAGRIWSETRVRPLKEAVAVAGTRAAAPIGAAGLVLAASFGLLALVPVRPFRELAFAMAAGLLIDTFLVRTLLVPALIALVGLQPGYSGPAIEPHERTTTAPAGRRRTMAVPRSRGAASGALLLLLGIWGALALLVGPYFEYGFGRDDAFNATTDMVWLSFLPGAAVIVGALILIAGRNRAGAALGAWLALAGGVWFAIGPAVSLLWDAAGPAAPVGQPLGSEGEHVVELLGSFYGLGALITALAAFALGRLATVSVRDLEVAEERGRR